MLDSPAPPFHRAAIMTTRPASFDDEMMRRALAEAEAAAARGEVPIGAVLVAPASEGGRSAVLAAAGNRTIELGDPTAHAEILALREGARRFGNHRLMGCTLYVTLEPCTMCAGAVSLARIDTLVFGAEDEKGGAVIHGARFFEQPTCHHRPRLRTGVLARDSADLLRAFFAARRG